MNAPFSSDHNNLPTSAPEGWPEARLIEWCDLHRIIEELSFVQGRLGTPMEQPLDFSRVRDLGTDIRERLDRLEPWLERAMSH